MRQGNILVDCFPVAVFGEVEGPFEGVRWQLWEGWYGAPMYCQVPGFLGWDRSFWAGCLKVSRHSMVERQSSESMLGRVHCKESKSYPGVDKGGSSHLGFPFRVK